MKELNELELSFIKENFDNNIDKLLLKYHKTDTKDIDYLYCINQIKLRKKFSDKFPFFTKRDDFLFPLSLNLEQSSSECTAFYKSLLVNEDETLLDLTAGFGIDDIYFAKRAKYIVCVEQNELLVDLLQHNFDCLGMNNYSCVNADAENYILNAENFDVIYLDPARRDENKNKVFDIASSQPNILKIIDLLKAKSKRLIFKLSPMMDLKQIESAFENISDIHIVSLKNECKEILVEIRKEVNEDINYHCVDIKSMILENNKMILENNKMISRKKKMNSSNNLFTSDVLKYIYEPNTSILKSGLFYALFEKYNIGKLHRHSHLFTADFLIEGFEGRSFEVLELRNASPKALKDIKQANITVRNFPQTVKDIRLKTKIKEGGELYLFFTTLSNEEKICIVSKKVN